MPTRNRVAAPVADAAPVDLLATAGTPVAKRVVPVVLAGFLIVIMWRRRRARS